MATRWDPFRELERLVDQTLVSERSGAVMPMDLLKSGDHYVIRVDLPGIDLDSIDVSVDDRMLTIRGERRTYDDSASQWLVRERGSGTFARQIALGRGLSLDAIKADYVDGVLTLTVPVAAAEAKPRRITVGRGGSQRSMDADPDQQQIAS